MRDGERTPERRSFPQLRFRSDLAFQVLYDQLTDRKPQAGPWYEGIEFGETFEHVRKVFFIDAFSLSVTKK